VAGRATPGVKTEPLPPRWLLDRPPSGTGGETVPPPGAFPFLQKRKTFFSSSCLPPWGVWSAPQVLHAWRRTCGTLSSHTASSLLGASSARACTDLARLTCLPLVRSSKQGFSSLFKGSARALSAEVPGSPQDPERVAVAGMWPRSRTAQAGQVDRPVVTHRTVYVGECHRSTVGSPLPASMPSTHLHRSETVGTPFGGRNTRCRNALGRPENRGVIVHSCTTAPHR
jgi:hypothetical protein